jgi:glycosyltransferase involved in cell wall biosynthesis
MLALAHAVDRSRFDLRVIAIGTAEEFLSDVPTDVSLERLQAGRLRAGLLRLVLALRRAKPDIVVSTLAYINFGVLGLRPLLPGSTRIVVREANVVSATLRAMPTFAGRPLYRWLYPQAAAVIAQTERIAAEIAAAAPGAADRICILANPVRETELRAGAVPVLRPATRKVVLVGAGRLTHQKGFDRLIELMPAIPNADLTIYGEGPERASLQARIDALGLSDRTRLAGFTDRLSSVIAGADVFVLSSRWEGMPNVVLEALALGTPVVAWEEAGVEDIAALAGAGAVTVAADGSVFAEAIRQHVPVPADLPRSSLLPPAYRADVVGKNFNALLLRVLSSG